MSCRCMGILVLLALLAVCTGCETPGRETGEREAIATTKGTFRGRWWNYYDRGLAFADAKRWKEAEADLREALNQRGEDLRWARTYGVRFIDYFPHRELGVVLFQQERYEEALRELETSLKGERSAKAEHYLDSTRRALILKGNQDTRPPDISVQSPAEDSLTNAMTCVVSGVATDDSYVKSVRIGSVPVRLDVAARQVPFRMEVPLKPGDNLIRVEAVDLTDKPTVMERRVRVSRQGPVLSIDEPVEGARRRPGDVKVKGCVYGDSGLQEIKINGRELPGAHGREVRLDHTLPTSENLDRVVIEAKDQAGNVTRAEISLTARAALPPGRILTASLNPVHLVSAEEPKTESVPGPLSIDLLGLGDEQTVFMDQVYLEGKVRDERGISALDINGQSVLRKPGKNIYFSHLSKLNEGENPFEIQARSSDGTRTQRRIVVHRKTPKVKEIGSRLRVAVFPLDRKGEARAAREPVEDSLLMRLMERRRFEMVERQRIDDVMKELKLNKSDAIDQDAAVRVGKLLGANGVLIGTVMGREGSLEIYTRLVDTETSLILGAADVYGEDIESGQVLRELCQGLSIKLCDELPMVEGLVVQVKGKRIVTDLGKESRLKKGMRVIVFDEKEPIRHPVTGAILGADAEQLGHAMIMAVMDQMSEAEILEEGVADKLKPMQKVITQ